MKGITYCRDGYNMSAPYSVGHVTRKMHLAEGVCRVDWIGWGCFLWKSRECEDLNELYTFLMGLNRGGIS